MAAINVRSLPKRVLSAAQSVRCLAIVLASKGFVEVSLDMVSPDVSIECHFFGNMIASLNNSWIAFHQLVVNQLVWFSPNSQVAAERTVQRKDHENHQPDKDREQQHLDDM